MIMMIGRTLFVVVVLLSAIAGRRQQESLGELRIKPLSNLLIHYVS